VVGRRNRLNHPAICRWMVISLGLALAVAAAPVHAASGAHDAADFLSGPGNLLFLGAGLVEPILTDPHDGKRHTLRVLDAVATATAGSEILKLATHERRPGNSHDYNSFPSGHTTAVFALASNLTEYYPRQAPFWYVGAAAIGWSRVELRRHRTTDVLAGAALGYWVGKVEARSRHGLLLRPIFSATGTSLGLTWQRDW
jgi:membrane-associated phospholipid phosphatase